MRRLRGCQRFANLPLNHFVPTVGIVWPARYAGGFLEWGATAGVVWDDEAVMAWRQRLHRVKADVDAVATIPSLVDHDNEQPSVLGHAHHGWRDAVCRWDSWRGIGGWQDGWE